MKTNLKPYNPHLYTPSQKPLDIGDLVVLLDSPRGYCGVVVAMDRFGVDIRLLDSELTPLKMQRDEVIQTGKTAQDLVRQYELGPVEFDQNLDTERSLPDFSKFKSSRKSSSGRKSSPKAKTLSPEAKEMIAKLLRKRLEEIKEQKND